MKLKLNFLVLIMFLSACVGPEYKKPEVTTAPIYKESNIKWQEAKPSAEIDRGEWWKIFHDSFLDDLISRLNQNNQDIASAAASYQQSLAIVDQARASWFPNISSTYASTAQKTNEQSTSTKKIEKDTSNHSANFTSSWELDVWGATKYAVASDMATAQSNKAALASTRLSLQSSLAQYYFELRAVDIDQQLLDEIVVANKKTVDYTKNKLKAGSADNAALLNAENALYNAKAAADNNKINRQQYVHAIAVLVGESPSTFSIKPIKNYKTKPVSIPLALPSQLLERRPDIAQSEEMIKQANAQIGVARTAFFPSTSLAASFGMQANNMGPLLQMPTFTWSLGPQMALGLFDGGSRMAQIKVSQAGYESTVFSYKQTVLSAFQEVEDQLSAINSLKAQVKSLMQAADNSKHLLNIAHNQYKSGIVDYSQVLSNQINYYNAKKLLTDTLSLKRSAEVTLIKALGGGWRNDLEN